MISVKVPRNSANNSAVSLSRRNEQPSLLPPAVTDPYEARGPPSPCSVMPNSVGTFTRLAACVVKSWLATHVPAPAGRRARIARCPVPACDRRARRSLAATSAMRGNRRADTAPELRLRSALHRRGCRFRKDFPARGRPPVRVDIVFPRKRLAVFVDGCFWLAAPGTAGSRRPTPTTGSRSSGATASATAAPTRPWPPGLAGPAHLGARAPRRGRRPGPGGAAAARAVSLFSGAGGMDLGSARPASRCWPAWSWTRTAAPACGPTPSPGGGCWRPTSGPSAPTRSGTTWGSGPASWTSCSGAALPAVLPDRQAGRGRRSPRLAAVRAGPVRRGRSAQGHLRRAGEGAAGRGRGLRPAAGGPARPGVRADLGRPQRGRLRGPQRRQRLILVAERDGGRLALPDPTHGGEGHAPSDRRRGAGGSAGTRPGCMVGSRTAATWT